MRLLRAGRVTGTFVVPLVLCVTVPGLTAGTPPSSAAAPAPPPALESVVVTLRAGTDLDGPGAAEALRPGAVKRRLQARAESSQRALRGALEGWRGQGEVASVRSLWISNQIAVTATPSVVRRLAARSDVLSVEPDRVVITPAADPSANQVTIGSPTVWAAGQTGQGVVVATLDSGVDTTDADLAASWRGGSNSWYDPYGQHATPADLTGHGTNVLGALVGGDDTGAAVGTAPGASWIAARIYNDAGGATLSDIHLAFQWLLDPDGNTATDDAPDIVNGSWSIGSGPSCNLEFRSDVQALRSAGILPVFAGGNFGGGASSSVSPANYPESLSVGAVNASDLIRSDSSRGPSDCGGRTRAFPDLVAPGTGIPTVGLYGLADSTNGTSVSAPQVAGAAALLLGARPALTPDQVTGLLTSSAVDLGAAGTDDVYGAGRLDVAAAYAALPDPAPDQLWFSTLGSAALPGLGAGDDADVYAWDGDTFGIRVEAATAGLGGKADIDGLDVVAPDHFYASFDVDTWVPGVGKVQDEDVVEYDAGAWSVFFNGTGHGLRAAGGDIDALTVRQGKLFFSTRGNVRVKGVSGTPDNADVYRWDGSRFTRVWRATKRGLPSAANVDGLAWVSSTKLAVSLSNDSLKVSGVGKVEDEDVISRGGRWTRTFDGSAHGLGGVGGLDLDAVDLP
ncbi:S8 family serine peptidase [Nocardioides sp.]|uniref:S8 family serine peptidase n=1 Tax=Nocardioides sp. TaxID=35761 RepID=UPI00352727F8